MSRIPILVALLFCAAPAVARTQEAAPPDLTKAIKERSTAVDKVDMPAWERYTTTRFTVVQPTGKMLSHAERTAEPGVDLLEDEARPAGAEVGERGRHPPRGVARCQRAALRVPHADRRGTEVGTTTFGRRLHHDPGRARQELGADVTRAGQVVGENAKRIHGESLQVRRTARAGAPSRSGNLSGRQTSV